jgi:plasmid maintenance system antidote protein VapI
MSLVLGYRLNRRFIVDNEDHQQQYRLSLAQLLEDRMLRNSRYSIRAFARDLDIDASHLFHILKGRKNISPRVAYRLALNLNYNEKETLEFLRPLLH